MFKKLVSVLLLLTMLTLCFASCKKSDNNGDDADIAPLPNGVTEIDQASNFVLLAIKGYGNIIIELYPDTAPRTVENFKKLVSQKFYDGLTFHRVIENFMIQGGDPAGDGTGGSPDNIKGEFSANGVENNLKHERGVISMARAGYSMDSASSQFFIMHKTKAHLDGQYAAFGKVIYGMDTVDKIALVDTDSNDKPLSSVVIAYAKFVSVTDTTFAN